MLSFQQQQQPQEEATMSKKAPATTKPSVYQIVTDRIIASLKAGVIPWEKPWQTPHFAGGPFPRNFLTGKPYRGINIMLLWSCSYSTPFWLTFNQAKELNGSVRKGEKGTQIVFYKQLRDRQKTDDEQIAEEDRRAPFVLTYHTVFNVEQCDGLTLPQIEQPPQPNPGYGPFIIVTSAHSPAIADWEGSGDAVIGIHGPLGDDTEIGTSGARISHGCIRLHDQALERLTEVPPGTPVDVVT